MIPLRWNVLEHLKTGVTYIRLFEVPALLRLDFKNLSSTIVISPHDCFILNLVDLKSIDC